MRGGIVLESPWSKLRGQVFVRLDEFIERLKPNVNRLEELKEITKGQHLVGRPRLEELPAGSHDRPSKIRIVELGQPMRSTGTSSVRLQELEVFTTVP